MRRLSRTAVAFAPFAGASVLAWIAVLVGSTIDWTQYAVASVLALAAGGLTLATVVGRVRWGAVPSALLFLAAVGLLRNSAGGSPSSASALAVIPVFYVALYSRSRLDLLWVLVGMALFYVVPVWIVGGVAYPTTQYRAALLALTVSSIIGAATQQLVAKVRGQAEQARGRERMLEQVSSAVHGLYDSPNPRADVCEAARTIGDATVALLYEPASGSGPLRCSAAAGGREMSEDGLRIVSAVFGSGVARLIEGGHEQWIPGGPGAVLYQPLIRAGDVLGVLVVGWTAAPAGESSRATVIALLAHEAAMVIARADVIDHLAGEAQTDALTGLPNRRAWDAQLQRALSGHAPLAVAMLDLDHFKQFNDAFGHPAGDRLLKETAAAWRDQLRSGDVLARLGGEEFGLLLFDCDAGTALDVVERLRRSISQGRTCSAGIAFRAGGEGADTLVARADAALYEAKSRGRDQARLSSAAAV
jgi:diguanylate cyclase (GGDEF)-like protein